MQLLKNIVLYNRIKIQSIIITFLTWVQTVHIFSPWTPQQCYKIFPMCWTSRYLRRRNCSRRVDQSEALKDSDQFRNQSHHPLDMTSNTSWALTAPYSQGSQNLFSLTPLSSENLLTAVPRAGFTIPSTSSMCVVCVRSNIAGVKWEITGSHNALADDWIKPLSDDSCHWTTTHWSKASTTALPVKRFSVPLKVQTISLTPLAADLSKHNQWLPDNLQVVCLPCVCHERSAPTFRISLWFWSCYDFDHVMICLFLSFQSNMNVSNGHVSIFFTVFNGNSGIPTHTHTLTVHDID